jgi:hypothetical protein
MPARTTTPLMGLARWLALFHRKAHSYEKKRRRYCVVSRRLLALRSGSSKVPEVVLPTHLDNLLGMAGLGNRAQSHANDNFVKRGELF